MVQCRASLLHKQHKHKQNSINIGFEYLAGELRIREQSKIKNFCPSRARVSRLTGLSLVTKLHSLTLRTPHLYLYLYS